MVAGLKRPERDQDVDQQRHRQPKHSPISDRHHSSVSRLPRPRHEQRPPPRRDRRPKCSATRDLRVTSLRCEQPQPQSSGGPGPSCAGHRSPGPRSASAGDKWGAISGSATKHSHSEAAQGWPQCAPQRQLESRQRQRDDRSPTRAGPGQHPDRTGSWRATTAFPDRILSRPAAFYGSAKWSAEAGRVCG